VAIATPEASAALAQLFLAGATAGERAVRTATRPAAAGGEDAVTARKFGSGADAPRGSPRSRKGLFLQSIEWLSTPAEAILTENDRSAWYRNDELLHILNAVFNADK
jgi:hypothetical protein